mmetsp:Transcript_1460/g.3311  ORF Transcript_1460/g.3311 Transcript_1460/m.3311 type:complete len:368 (+) Transcript_1460:99-1202(+)
MAASVSVFTFAEEGDLDNLRQYLEGKGDPNLVHPSGGYTLLHRVAGAGHDSCLELLLAASANPDAENKGGSTPLHAAARRNHSHCVNSLLQAGADPNVHSKSGETPSDVTRCEQVREALRQEVNVEEVEWLVTTKKRLQSAFSVVELYKLLSDAETDREVIILESARRLSHSANSNDFNPFEAAEKGDAQGLSAFLSAKGDPNQYHSGVYSLLHRVAGGGYIDCLQLLLEYGANPGARNKFGATPLHGAARRGHVECVRALLAAGADPSFANKAGETALHVASTQEVSDVLREASSPSAGDSLEIRLLRAERERDAARSELEHMLLNYKKMKDALAHSRAQVEALTEELDKAQGRGPNNTVSEGSAS